MRIPTRDLIATVLVACAIVVYTLWATGWTLPGMESVRVTGSIILGLGFAASASAVVPGFDELLHGNKVYLLATSLIGVAAFVAGVVMLVSASEVALGIVIAAMVVLWMIATIHHTLWTTAGTESGYPTAARPGHGQRPAGVA
jgi:hypothetical protein